jgi:hypothetical protein
MIIIEYCIVLMRCSIALIIEFERSGQSVVSPPHAFMILCWIISFFTRPDNRMYVCDGHGRWMCGVGYCRCNVFLILIMFFYFVFYIPFYLYRLLHFF